jgi:tight adherence protein C
MSAAMSDLLTKATPQLAKPLQPKDEAEAGKLKTRLAHAGFRSENATTILLGLKVFCGAIALVIAGLVISSIGLNKTTILRSLMGLGIAFFLPDFVVWMITNNRKQAIFLGLPDALDLMVVCVEAGLGLDQAMLKVAEEMKKCFPLISREFFIANMQLQMGIPRAQALRELGDRNGEDDLMSLCSALIQAGKFGSGVGKALRVQSDAMRTRRKQLAEERASKCAVKLVFPLVLFIFPGVFVALVGPAAVFIVNNLLPSMGGR